MPFASEIAITLGGVDITNKVLYATARFESQLGAVPGLCEFVVKDTDQTFDATTGDEIVLLLDGVPYWGGFALTIERIFAFPVVDTSDPGAVTTRQFRILGTDYNILFDKRVIHNPDDHFHHLPYFTLDQTMGDLLRNDLFANYLDISGDGLDTTTFVDDVYVPRFDANGTPDPDATKKGSWPQQGSYWRKAMDDFAQFGAVYYISGAKAVHFHEVEDTLAAWGFSDVPNNLPLPNAGATYGMREFEHVESAGAMANDAFVWGGSEWAGSGGTVFKRAQNATSITDHGRWQIPEVRFGDLRTQGEVTARANVIVSGNTTGAVGGDTSRGLAVDENQIKCVWFAHDVPLDGPDRAHLRAADVVTFTMYVMSENGVDPFVITLPLRSVRITFPTLPHNNPAHDPVTYAKFEGQFGLQMSDPYFLWKFLRDLSPTIRPPAIVSTADDSTDAVVYGTRYSAAPTPATDDVETVFTIPFAYIPGTTEVYKGAPGSLVLMVPGVDYVESDAEGGEITFLTAPSSAHDLWIVCRLSGSTT